MNEFFQQLSEMQKSMLLSVTAHLVLLLLFVFLRSGLDFPDQEFAEIGFVSATTARMSRPATTTTTTVTPPQQSQTQPKANKEEALPKQPSTQPKKEAQAPPVNVPKRRMLEEEEPELTKRTAGKLTPEQENSRVTPRDDVYDAETMQKDVAESTASGKEFSDPGATSGSGKTTPGPASDIGGDGSDQPYTLEGDASRRTILNQVLPAYPPGLQREAVVKIRFWVLPDGRVGSMIPVRKGDPTLEEITMKAIRQWRFNTLPPGEEQRNVEGIITFVYKLQ